MGSLDIIVYAVIAAIVLARLWSVLGRRDGDEPQRPNPFVAPAPPPPDEGDVLRLPARIKTEDKPPVITEEGHAIASLAGGLDQIKKLDPTFDEKQFLQGARTAFEMIVTAFAQKDLANVSRLLTAAMQAHFKTALPLAAPARLDKITEADVAAARTDGTQVFLSVNFTSHQTINGTREEIHDLWTFTRNTKSPDPNWLLAEIKL